MAAKFPYPMQAAFAFTQRPDIEGGLKPSGALGDPNRAFRGINQSTYDRYRTGNGLPTRDVAEAAPQEVVDVYKSYWTDFFCGVIAPKSGALAVCHFDCEFNGGGTTVLEDTAGNPHGPLTLDEVNALLATLGGESGEDGTISAYLQNRLDRFRGLKNWPEAGDGWMKRLDKLAAYLEVSWRTS